MDYRGVGKILKNIRYLIITINLIFCGCLKNNSQPDRKILFLGNSITWSPPNLLIGWPGDWGMAASSGEKDYAHRTVDILNDRGIELEMGVARRYCYCDGPIEEHLANMDYIREFGADYIVVQLGEHPSPDDITSGKMAEQYGRLIEALSELNPRQIYCLSPWKDEQPGNPRTQVILNVVENFPLAAFIDTRSIYSDSANLGDPQLFQLPSVLWHPGDRGMESIAQSLASAVMEDAL
ncbi:hypothetical protein ACFL5V_03985 [Fibrobacterota bacterium]